MTNPVVALVNEIYENDNNFPNLACELVTRYPDYTFATYHVASAILALSLRLGLSDRPDDLIVLLESLVVGNHNLNTADMESLKRTNGSRQLTPSGGRETMCLRPYSFFGEFTKGGESRLREVYASQKGSSGRSVKTNEYTSAHMSVFSYHKVSQQARNAQPGKLPCPTCRELTSIPENGISGLRSDFKAHKLEKVFRMMTVHKRASSCMCDPCKSKKMTVDASVYCSKCKVNYCKACLLIHNKNLIFKDHEVVETSLRENLATELTCKTCNSIVCTLCIIKDHSGHPITEVDELYVQQQQDMRNLQQIIDSKVERQEIKKAVLDSERTLILCSHKEPGKRLRGGKMKGLKKTASKETGRKEKGWEESDVTETGAKEKGGKETGGKATG
ncbi:hypothetical protein LSAT2_000473 [Lamellibrachia satsuma]|nr:hypothetical protein LSAT2_000473 [Lamellibrachia satsuma]